VKDEKKPGLYCDTIPAPTRYTFPIKKDEWSCTSFVNKKHVGKEKIK
jgi:hypothetical protein